MTEQSVLLLHFCLLWWTNSSGYFSFNAFHQIVVSCHWKLWQLCGEKVTLAKSWFSLTDHCCEYLTFKSNINFFFSILNYCRALASRGRTITDNRGLWNPNGCLAQMWSAHQTLVDSRVVLLILMGLTAVQSLRGLEWQLVTRSHGDFIWLSNSRCMLCTSPDSHFKFFIQPFT